MLDTHKYQQYQARAKKSDELMETVSELLSDVYPSLSKRDLIKCAFLKHIINRDEYRLLQEFHG